MAAIGEMYRVNRSGPKTESCGTPHLSFRVADVELPMVTKNEQIGKKEAKVEQYHLRQKKFQVLY
jgi:hypothetical protein